MTVARAEVIVLGGGPAGAAAAAALASAGRDVVLVEREAAPREKVCGEFLGPDAVLLLRRLGLDPAALGAVSVDGAMLAAGGRAVALPLPFRGWSLPRAVLDEALLCRAAAAGAVLHRGRAATGAVPEGEDWVVPLAGGAVLRGGTLVLATGKHALRGFPRGAAGVAGGWLGLKLPIRLPAVPGSVLLLPFGGGYAGLQPRAGGGANLCLALRPGEGAAAMARDAAALLARVRAGSRLAAGALEGAVPDHPRPLAVAGVPYGFRHRDGAAAPPRLYRVGDQFAVIPSFTGDGMAMALAGGLAAAAAILAGESAARFHRQQGARFAPAMRWAGGVAALLHGAPGVLATAAALWPSAAALVARRTRVPGLPRDS
ncbi:NAD(P)/FAD-dependent oxidoreductase [Roseomonas elaeocarpi]|uniref:NAD(P)/FAD-dependent oxidoreductase n=1 Tax=Roseomonas elaeocarpi TaxID=907779 RepID=A0ABV6JYN8_9PROT